MESKFKNCLPLNVLCLLSLCLVTPSWAGAIWLDYQSVNVGQNSASGRTGQWWCTNNFGINLGGIWECAENTGSYCTSQAPNNTLIQCGKINQDGTTNYSPINNIKQGFGYGRVERVLVTQSAQGRTGKWWCDNNFGANLGGNWKCRSVTGANSCESTVPNNELVSCSKYDDSQTINVANLNAPGRTGQWWCTNHFGGNLGGNWDCLSVIGGGSCSTDVAANASVSCGRYKNVSETEFEPPACNAMQLDSAEQEFCTYTEYMTNRKRDTVYLYNDYVRAGINRSFGGALFELYGVDKRNRIEEHGGSAVQMSLWGYDINASGAGYFLTTSCSSTPYTDAATCKAVNSNQDCRVFPITGGQLSNCISEKGCGTWSAAAPWNPIQAQAVDCGWNGTSNDISGISEQYGTVTFTKSNPYNFTKTTSFNWLTWQVSVVLPNDRPFIQAKYTSLYSGPYSLGPHNQEMPAIFTDNSISYWYYFYSGGTPYSNASSSVTRLRSDFGTQLKLPTRNSQFLPQPPPPQYYSSGEDWLTVCDRYEDQCLTIATLSPDIITLALNGSYLTALGRYSINNLNNKTWSVYFFPYRFDDVVAGKSVRQWIYDLKTGVIN
ncbi:MAG: hypothetical protein HY066_08705 [Betaproteobacteria bacterium]|nr:hypothetical protein [Betaproteobacteria bacterium]